MAYRKPNRICYAIAQVACFAFATAVFRRKFLRNEIRGKKGPFVVVANHQAAYDFANLMGATARPMSFVISNSFYRSLPLKGFLKSIGVIPKQQFQTTATDLKRMKEVIDRGEALVIYPAGLMCEDGLSTPIPEATYKFLKWLKADVYVARTDGTYFAMPKWSKKTHPGKTTLDIYRLFTKEELEKVSVEEVREQVDGALLFDAYRKQEEMLVAYHKGNEIAGLENVLYACPCCGREFTISLKEPSTLFCTACGFETESDKFGFFHTKNPSGAELRYVSDWSRKIYDRLKEKMRGGEISPFSLETEIWMIDETKHKFVPVGEGEISFDDGRFVLMGKTNEGDEISVCQPAVPSLPFSPGNYLELQEGERIYRCRLKEGKQVMKLIHLLKISFELQQKSE